MKKQILIIKKVDINNTIILLFAALLSFCSQSFSQSCEGTPLLNETFENGIPGTWTILNLDAGIVTASYQLKGYTGLYQPFIHYGRKCVANTSRFTTAISTDDWLITPAVTLGSAPVCLSWLACSASSPGENYEVHISNTTPTITGMNANASLFVQTSENIRWTEYSVDLSAYAGQTVYIGFYYNSISTTALYLDNIRISQPVSLDASVTSLSLNDVVAPGSYPVTGTLLNGGLTTINSMNLNWEVNNGPVNTTSLSSLSIAPSSYYNYTHSVNWTPSAYGEYTFKIWATDLNGQSDQYHSNDTLTHTIFVYNYPRKALFEEFSNTGCVPCADQNPHLDSILSINRLSGKISDVKYHVWWPDVNDPMYVFNTTENQSRVKYYGEYGVPMLQVDGLIIPDHCGFYDGAPGCLDQNDIDSAQGIPSVFQIKINNSVSDSNFNGSVKITALTDISYTSLVLRTVVVEDTIIYGTAPGTNGETNFYQIMRKMLPDADGTTLSPMMQNQTYTYDFSWPINTPCNASQLRTVAFIQDENTTKVWQSEITNSSATGIRELAANNTLQIYPNPATSTLTIENTKAAVGSMQSAVNNIEIYNLLGEMIYNLPITDNHSPASPRGEPITINVADFPSGVYVIQVRTEKGVEVRKFIKE